MPFYQLKKVYRYRAVTDNESYGYYLEGTIKFFCIICGLEMTLKSGGMSTHIMNEHFCRICSDGSHYQPFRGNANFYRKFINIRHFDTCKLCGFTAPISIDNRDLTKHIMNEHFCLIHPVGCDFVEEWIDKNIEKKRRVPYSKKPVHNIKNPKSKRKTPLKPWKDPESLFCDTNFLENLLEKEIAKGDECKGE